MKRRKLLSLLLCLALCLSMLPSAMAEGAETEASPLPAADPVTETADDAGTPDATADADTPDTTGDADTPDATGDADTPDTTDDAEGTPSPAAEAPEPAPLSGLLPDQWGDTAEIPMPEDLLDGYAQQALDSALPTVSSTGKPALYASVGTRLTGSNRILYDRLKAQIAQVASGERTSTILTVPMSELNLQWTAEDLGLDYLLDPATGQWNPDLATAVGDRWQAEVDLDLLLTMLLEDCPYELYWYDKTLGSKQTGIGYSCDYGASSVIMTGTYTLKMPVANEYATGQGEYDSVLKKYLYYEVDPATGTTVSAAVDRARAIVAEAAGRSDYEKMIYFKDQICALTSYNYSAVRTKSTPYGNPWQLIWVFDGDESTQVVCEGYAKAFQYLFDLSGISACSCVIVTGTMNGGTGAGGHMWNIVTMEDGLNYLVDVTNCDSGTIGAPDLLFLAGTTVGSVAEGYVVPCGKSSLEYIYDEEEALNIFAESELMLAPFPYIPGGGSSGIPVDEIHFPDPALRAFAAAADTDGSGRLNAEECLAVTAIDLSDSDLADLTGLEYFHALRSLKCDNTALTIADLSQHMQLSSFSFRGCTQLTELALPADSGVAAAALTRIPARAFSGCTSLSLAEIPPQVREIGAGAFTGCTALELLAFGGDAPVFGSNCFSGVEASAMYHYEGAGWSEDVMLDYGGHITWYPVCSHEQLIQETFEADCETPAGTHVSCPICGYDWTMSFGEPLGHTPGDPVREKELAATCETSGRYDEVVYCTACHKELSRETVSIPRLQHKAGEVVRENEVAPGCETKGSYEAVTYCSNCGKELSRRKLSVAALGHTRGEAVTENVVPAGCENLGSSESAVYCTVCGKELSRDYFYEAALGHSPGEPVRENQVPASCETPGSYDDVVYCSACQKELSRETVTVPAPGHDYQDGVCTRCGAADLSAVLVTAAVTGPDGEPVQVSVYPADTADEELLSGASEPLWQGEIASGDSIRLDSLAAGDYKLLLRQSGRVAVRIQPFTAAPGTTDLGQLRLCLYGDVNRDGTVDALDVLDLQLYAGSRAGSLAALMNDPPALAYGLEVADVDFNGTVNALDVLNLQLYVGSRAGTLAAVL